MLPPGHGLPGAPAYYPPHTSTNAVVALVVSIAGFFVCPLLGIVGIVLGRGARRDIRASGGRETGEGIATAAEVIGWIEVVLAVLVVIVLIGIFLLIVLGAAGGGIHATPTCYGC